MVSLLSYFRFGRYLKPYKHARKYEYLERNDDCVFINKMIKIKYQIHSSDASII